MTGSRCGYCGELVSEHNDGKWSECQAKIAPLPYEPTPGWPTKSGLPWRPS